jgi:hypothetical protein
MRQLKEIEKPLELPKSTGHFAEATCEIPDRASPAARGFAAYPPQIT